MFLTFVFVGLVLFSQNFCLDSNGNYPFFPANSAILVATLLLPVRLTLLTCLISFGANVLVDMNVPYLCSFAILLAGLNVALGVTAGVLTRGLCGAASDLTRPRRLSMFTLICFATAGLEAGVGCVLQYVVASEGPYDNWFRWTFCDGLGLLLATPAILLGVRSGRTKGSKTLNVEKAGIMSGTILLAVLGFTWTRSPLCFALYPALILMAFRAGPAWIQSTVLLICLVASSMTAHGHGPLAQLFPHDGWLGVDLAQPYLISLFLTAMPANILTQEQKRSAQRMRRLKQGIEYDATHDVLTNLLNRKVFQRRVALSLQDETFYAVLLVDLDRFKVVNDTMGHLAGDALLRMFSARLIAAMPEAALIARLGGDEFAVLLTRQAAVEDVFEEGTAILQAADMPFDLVMGRAHVTASVGVAMASFVEESELSEGEVMRRADIALYAAKATGRRGVRVFTSHMDREVQGRAELEKDLRSALVGGGGLALHYQVKTTREGVVQGVEALLRWTHTRLGLIPPSRLIPIAEETGLILPLGNWVIAEAAAFASRWPALSVAVNVSPLQLLDETFVARTLQATSANGVAPSRIELEVTETVFLDEAGAALAHLERLRVAGFSIALDDFGTGFSSLRQLQRFKVDRLKIDQSFTQKLGSRNEAAAIVKAIVDLGHAMGLQVTAEGVENEFQWQILAELGVDELQGYFFGRPVEERVLAARMTSASAPLAMTGD